MSAAIRGFFKMSRGWLDHPVLRGEPFNRATAWVWMIERARWKDGDSEPDAGGLSIRRGQFVASEKDLATAWAWSKSRVHRFVSALKADAMIEIETNDKTTVITLKNYDRYQCRDVDINEDSEPAKATESASLDPHPNRPEPVSEPVSEPAKATESASLDPHPNRQPNRQPNHNIKERRFKNGKNNGAGYAFQGTVIRLTQRGFDQWKITFHGIADLRAELAALDAWLVVNPDRQKKWFGTVSGALNKKHQELISGAGRGASPANAYKPRMQTTVPEELVNPEKWRGNGT